MKLTDSALARIIAEEQAQIAARGAEIGTGDWAADGGTVGTTWHRGASASEIYYERFQNGLRTAHGWIDAATRNITQTG